MLVGQVSSAMLQRTIFYIIFPVLLIINTAVASDAPAGQNGGSKQDKPSEAAISSSSGTKQEQVTIRANAGFAIPGFELRNHKFADRSIHYLRDQVFFTGASVYYRGGGLGARAGVCDAKKPSRRVTSDFEVEASYFHRAFGAEAYYRQSGRYYIAHSPYGTGSMWNRAGAGSRIRTEAAGANFFVFMKDLLSLNKDYSYRSSFQQSDRQPKSSGTFIILAGVDYFKLRGPAALVPGYDRFLLMGLNLFGMTGWRFIGGSFGVGFAYTLVLPRDFFIAPLIALAVHPYQLEFFTPSGTKHDIRIESMKGHGRINAGYNGERYFAGLSVTIEAELDPAEQFHTVIWNVDLNAGLFAGVRI